MNRTATWPRKLKNVLIIHEEGNSFNNPSLKCIIDLLLSKGCEIDLRYPRRHAPMPAVKGVRFLPFGNTLRRFKSVASNILCFEPLIFLSVLVEKLILYKKYDLIIGVDRLGLIEASILNVITKTPYIFLSFEISFASETSHRFKSLEKRASKNVSLWIVQDEVRAQHLQFENQLQESNKFLLPLASASVGALKIDRLRDQLGIPADKKVAITIGSVSKWSMTGLILKCIVDWPDDWVFVVHERYGRTSELLKNEVASFKELLGHKIYISDAASDTVDDLGSILAGVSAGLALYEPDASLGIYGGKNLQSLGLASGKICTYLRYGVPVIINEIGIYAEEARRYRFGCVVDQPKHIIDNLTEVAKVEYRNNALKYYSNKLDFNRYSNKLFSRLLSVVDDG